MYLFLKSASPKELKKFCEEYKIYLDKEQATSLQKFIREIPMTELRFPLNKTIQKDLKRIIGDKNFKRFDETLQKMLKG